MWEENYKRENPSKWPKTNPHTRLRSKTWTWVIEVKGREESIDEPTCHNATKRLNLYIKYQLTLRSCIHLKHSLFLCVVNILQQYVLDTLVCCLDFQSQWETNSLEIRNQIQILNHLELVITLHTSLLFYNMANHRLWLWQVDLSAKVPDAQVIWNVLYFDLKITSLI